MRELEIKMLVPLQKKHWILLLLSSAILVALPWTFFFGITQDPFYATTQVVVFLFLIGQSILRLRYLKSLALRIDEDGLAWRLIDGIDVFQRMRPPISEHKVRWDALRGVRHEATGMRCFLRDGADIFLPLSNFSYAQRQDIKRVTALHLAEREVPEMEFIPVGWHDIPDHSTQGAAER